MPINFIKQDFKARHLVGTVLTLGVIFANLATSPLYVLNVVLPHSGEIDELFIFGTVSLIFWTLTIQTTIKYVLVASKVNNRGEGGIFSLFTLIKQKSPWIAVLTMIAASALLASGVIMPAITVTSAVEGFRVVNTGFPVVAVILVTFALCFFIQQFGANILKFTIGPVMGIWFLMLAFTGIYYIMLQPQILVAFSPAYSVELLAKYPGALVIPGLIFLSTTGAELLYSNLGQIGIKKLRISWIVVKLILIINYFGQGAWLLTRTEIQPGTNPFFASMPEWFLIPGILIALAASIIASQALISGSYTLLGEAISLNFWPRIRVYYPTQQKGQIYIPMLNWFLWIACSLFVITYREPSNMAAAYGLSVIIPMIITTLLLSYYMYYNGIINHRLVLLFLMIFIVTEGTFFISILSRIWKGGWITLILSGLFFALMYGWYFGRKIRNRYITFADLDKYIDLFKDLVHDESIPRFATNLVYIIHANRIDQVESKVIYSIFHRQPKRADKYWFLHIDRVEEPDRFEYHVTHIIPGILIRVDFHIGFKIEQKINLYFREVLEDLETAGEIKLNSSYDSLRKHEFPGDFKFIIIERIIPRDFNLSNWEKITMLLNNIAKYFSLNDIKALKLDSTNTIVEQVPITADQPIQQRIRRI